MIWCITSLDAVPHDLVHLLVSDVSQVPEDAEDDEAGVDGGERVEDGDEDGVAVRVVVDVVVRGEYELAAKTNAQREEDLKGKFDIYKMS